MIEKGDARKRQYVKPRQDWAGKQGEGGAMVAMVL